MSDTSARILPPVTALTEPYWTGCRKRELRLQQCDACGKYQFYPRILCSHCGHDSLSWRRVSGRGRIASFTGVRRPRTDAYPAPTMIALVDLDEGPRMMSSVVDAEPDSLHIGQAVRVDFAAWSEEISMPVFRIATEEASP